MKRSKKMFTRITSMLHTAVEAFAPEMTLLEQFRYHWKCVTQFFLDTSDERIAVENTTIPEHLEQMIEVLRIEEQENGVGSAGPAMEFMLQHKILETMQTLGKADCPPGMKRYVLVFFTKLLGKLKQQLLPHVNVHKPVNKLIRCCGHIKAAPTETEEVHFLLQVSSKLKQDSYLVNFFLEKPASTETGTSPPLSPGGIGSDREKPEYSLVDSLLALTKSEQKLPFTMTCYIQHCCILSVIDSRVAIKACEGLILVTSIIEDNAALVIVLYTAFCERMADQLSKLFRGLPQVLDPADISQSSATWGFDHDDQLGNDFVGKRQLTAFFSWLDYVNQLSVEAHPMVSKALAQAIRERFILTAIESGLSQASEPCAITVTAILTKCLKLVSSATLAQEFASILLGNDMNPEVPDYESPHKLRRLLIHRINHLSDHLSVETLRLFQALLQLSYQPIIDTLIVRNFQHRNYIDWNKMRKSKKPISRTASISSKNDNIKNNISSDNKKEDDDLKIEKEKSLISFDEVSNDTADKLLTNETTTVETEVTFIETIENNQNTVDVKTIESTESNEKEGIETSSDNTVVRNIAEDEKVPDTPKQEDNSISNVKTTDDEKENEDFEKTSDDIDDAVVTIEFNKKDKKKTNKKKKDIFNDAPLSNDNSALSPNENMDESKTDDSFVENLTNTKDDNFSKGFIKKKIEKAVNGFLLILPDNLKTSMSSGETGYDSYLREAHKQCQQRAAQEFTYDWPSSSCLEDDEEPEETFEFYEGAFLNTIFRRLERMLDQPYDINLEVTGILSMLCQFRHPYLHEFLIDTSGLVKDSVFTLHRILLKVCQDIKNRGVKNQQALAAIRKNLHDPSQHIVEIPDEIFLQGIVVLEEFCKELAAIAFVSATRELSED